MDKRVHVWVQEFRDRPTLQLQWHDPRTGKRRTRSAGTTDHKEAEQGAADLSHGLSRGQHQEPARLTWERFRETFEAEYFPGIRPETRRVYARAFIVLEREARPGLLSSITARTLSALAAAQRQRVAPSTLKVRLQFLRTALRWGARQGLLAAVPEFPTVKVPKRRPQPVPVELWERLLQAAPDDQWRAFLSCAWLAGCRLGEAYALSWTPGGAPWVDLAARRLHFPAEAVKGCADSWVPLADELAALLLALPRRGSQVFHFHGLTAHSVGCQVARLARTAGVRLSY